MPVYEYECAACGRRFEEMQKISAAALKKCMLCGKAGVRRLISKTSFQLKGTGWYQTDYARKKSSKGKVDKVDKDKDTKDSTKKEGEAVT